MLDVSRLEEMHYALGRQLRELREHQKRWEIAFMLCERSHRLKLGQRSRLELEISQ